MKRFFHAFNSVCGWYHRRERLPQSGGQRGCQSTKTDPRLTQEIYETLKKPIKIMLVLSTSLVGACGDESSSDRGKKAFKKCVTCHSMEPGKHLIGPSLSNIVGREAGTVEGFMRYSKALKSSSMIWDEITVDAWLKSPRQFIPGNRMAIKGISSPQERADIISYIKTNSTKNPEPPLPVTLVRLCRDTYHVTISTKKTLEFKEAALNLKTDSSATGPKKGTPVLISTGDQGDLANLVFSKPGEITPFIKVECTP